MNTQNEKIPRIIGTYSGVKKGPLLFVTAGVHGNEPSGVLALQKVLSELHKSKPDILGTIVGVIGNRAAFQAGKRYIDEDLNRAWTEENVSSEIAATSEQQEMKEIIAVLERFPEENYTKRYFLDCHTTSAETLPFISVQDVGDNDTWAHNFPVHIVRGFSDLVYGCIDHYFSRIGMTGFVLEAGQHESKGAASNHEGIIWLALQKACGLDLHNLISYPNCVQSLMQFNTKRKTFEILYRHPLQNEDTFAMRPGFANFQPIEKAQILATHNDAQIHSTWDDFIFMPLYQSQGNDGFFVVQEVN